MGLGWIKLDNLMLIGKEYHEIKASKEGEKDGGFWALEFSEGGAHKIKVTCGIGWDNEVQPGKVVHFDPQLDLIFGRNYNCTFDLNNDKGMSSVPKLRTFKLVGGEAEPKQPAPGSQKAEPEQQTLPGTQEAGKKAKKWYSAGQTRS